MEAESISFSAENLAKLIVLVEKKVITGTVAKGIFEVMFAENVNPEDYAAKHDLITKTDTSKLEKVIMEVIESNPESIRDYRNGKDKAIGFLVGQSMKAMKGQADATLIQKMLKDTLTQS